jgi:2-oxoglutarate dehydrogenase E2 component (dihydrolipoamide succinyltransferase)
MKKVEIKVPSPGESITEVIISRWLVENGSYVERDQAIAEIDSDKATLTVAAEANGKIEILAKEEETIKVGSVICTIDESVKAPESKKPAPKSKETRQEKSEEKPSENFKKENSITPLAKKIAEAQKVPVETVKGSGERGKITRKDVEEYLSGSYGKGEKGERETERKKLSALRKKLAGRLVAVKNETAMLTTFNEVDMTEIMRIRKSYNPALEKKHGLKIGFMGFFTVAVAESLKKFPQINSRIDGDEIVTPSYCDIGIAVSTPKGLMVPVIRSAETISVLEVENEIKRLAEKARDGKIEIKDMEGGTFTITNGGVFGSLLSTPIINPPQSAILGMHNIVERPVAFNGAVVIRPMMYVALSYDHRIIDGKESVSFLVSVKEMLENPSRILFGGKNPEEILLGL